MKKFEKNGNILNYLSIISQLIIVLVDIESGKNNFFTQGKRDELTKKGKGIIEDILNGSNFIENKVFKKGFSPQSITMFNYGIKSLESETKIDKKEKSYTDIFNYLSDKMSDVCSNKSNTNDINLLIDFFKSLKNILSVNYNSQRDPVDVDIKSKIEHIFVYN